MEKKDNHRKILVIGMAGLGVHAQSMLRNEATLRSLSIVKLEDIDKELQKIKQELPMPKIDIPIVEDYSRIHLHQGKSGQEARREARAKERKQLKPKYGFSKKFPKKRS